MSTTIPQTDIISTNKQLINAVSLSSDKCTETSDLCLFHGYICIQQSNFRQTRDLNKSVQTHLKPNNEKTAAFKGAYPDNTVEN